LPFGGAGVSRVDARDVGEAAANALTQPGHEDRRYPVVGPESLTGEAMAAAWSRHLGREIRYAGDDLDAWETLAADILTATRVRALRPLYRFFQERGQRASADDLACQARVLGRPPRAYADFVRQTAHRWMGRQCCAA
jgi:uncharacterized protein YbjT (DUF2867 family)